MLKKPEEIRHLLVYCFDICLKTGHVLINTARALVRHSGKRLPALKQISRDIRLLFNCIGLKNAVKVLQREKQLKRLYPKQAYHYLWYIGVLPEHSGQGKGTTLLQEIMTRASEKNYAVYLETSVDKNVRWYQKRSFDVYGQLQFGHSLFTLRWPHEKTGR